MNLNRVVVTVLPTTNFRVKKMEESLPKLLILMYQTPFGQRMPLAHCQKLEVSRNCNSSQVYIDEETKAYKEEINKVGNVTGDENSK